MLLDPPSLLAAKLQTPIVIVAFLIILLLSAAIEVYGSPMNAMVKSFEIWHTYSGQSL